MSSYFWIYWVASVAVTIATLGVWAVYNSANWSKFTTLSITQRKREYGRDMALEEVEDGKPLPDL